jgi:hypothetical protein
LTRLSGARRGARVPFIAVGDTYVFSQGDVGASVNDVLVKLVGVAGVTHLAENGATDQFFVV